MPRPGKSGLEVIPIRIASVDFNVMHKSLYSNYRFDPTNRIQLIA